MMMNFLKTYGTSILLVALYFASFFAMYHLGYRAGQANVQAKWDAEKVVAAQHAQELLHKGLDLSYKIGLQYESEKQEVVERTQTIVKEIPVYIKDTSACRKLPNGWGLLHNIGAGH